MQWEKPNKALNLYVALKDWKRSWYSSGENRRKFGAKRDQRKRIALEFIEVWVSHSYQTIYHHHSFPKPATNEMLMHSRLRTHHGRMALQLFMVQYELHEKSVDWGKGMRLWRSRRLMLRVIIKSIDGVSLRNEIKSSWSIFDQIYSL